ncbi:MAG: cytochrome c3 family protein [Bryobacterales bacterium]|nr:cytochrome c3 family protein [Bryobacterales bacterium]
MVSRALLFLLLAGTLSGQYAGRGACAGCHRKQSEGHERTGHARSLAVPSAHRFAERFAGVKADWAFGAGEQAVTFVARRDDEHYVEQGLSWYAATGRMELTPGHRHGGGEIYRTFDAEASILRCFQCHSTGPLRLGEGYRIEPPEAGVQCETCHGPGKAHAESGAAVRNPARLTAVQINQLCGECHRKPAATGDETDWGNAWNARHQPLYLAESACFQKSGGRLSCFTCHAPHAELERAAEAYGKVCGSCHAKPRHRAATVASKGTCVGCHMPAVKPNANLSFANHWIGVYGAGSVLRPGGRRRLVVEDGRR